MSKTDKEIQNLKDNWLKDPCYDIEDVPGFEEYHNQLLKFANEYRKAWTEKATMIQTHLRLIANEDANRMTYAEMLLAQGMAGVDWSKLDAEGVETAVYNMQTAVQIILRKLAESAYVKSQQKE